MNLKIEIRAERWGSMGEVKNVERYFSVGGNGDPGSMRAKAEDEIMAMLDYIFGIENDSRDQ